MNGYKFSPDDDRAIQALINIPTDWEKVNYYLLWTTHVAGTGVVLWCSQTAAALQTSWNPTSAFPVGGIAPVDAHTRRVGSALVAGDEKKIHRLGILPGGSNEHKARGVHSIYVGRFGIHGSDTLTVDAIFLGCLFERAA